MAGDEATCQADLQTLQAGRSGMPAEAASGTTALGVRQPGALNRDKKWPPDMLRRPFCFLRSSDRTSLRVLVLLDQRLVVLFPWLDTNQSVGVRLAWLDTHERIIVLLDVDIKTTNFLGADKDTTLEVFL